MKTIILKSTAANYEQQVKQIEELYLVGNDVQDTVDARNEGFHICQESIKVKNAFGKGSFTLQPDTSCLVWAIEDDASAELEYMLQFLCSGNKDREEALSNCKVGVLNQKQEEDIYSLLEPISLVSSEEPEDETQSEEERAFKWLAGLDDVAKVAIAWMEYQNDGNIGFAVNTFLWAANMGSVRAKNIIRNIIINAKIPRYEKIV